MRLRLLLCAGIVGLAAAALAGSGAAAVAAQDPNAIGCPSAPSGWGDPAVSKIVATPQSVPPPADAPERESQGGNTITVTCQYHHGDEKQATITVSVALPTDPNPISDFYFGCGHGDVPWDTTNRAYSVGSTSQWAVATFTDEINDVPNGEVASFEKVAQQLLQNTNGYGHPCKLVLKPTETQGRVYFDINVGGTTIKDTFWTPPVPNGNGIYPIKHISALNAALRVPTKNGTRLLAIKLSKGIDFRAQTPKAKGRVRFRVLVTSSKVPSCKRGAAGTLTISTQPAVQLDVCGQTFHPGPAPRQVQFYNN
jgi:uncharacterized protein YcnI